MYMYYTVSNRILPSCKDTHCSPVSFMVLYYWFIISRQFSTKTAIAENQVKCRHIKAMPVVNVQLKKLALFKNCRANLVELSVLKAFAKEKYGLKSRSLQDFTHI